MPINEILAPYYVRVRYVTWASQHNLTLYLGNGTLTKQANGDYSHSLMTNSANPNGLISQCIASLFGAAYDARASQSPTVEAIELWKSQPGNNLLIDFVNPVTPIPNSGFSRGIAASYFCVSGIGFSGSSRQQWRLFFFEAQQDASPQRMPYVPGILPQLDAWLNAYTQTSQAVVSQDGYPLLIRAYNMGYNRKLARAYGRRLTP